MSECIGREREREREPERERYSVEGAAWRVCSAPAGPSFSRSPGQIITAKFGVREVEWIGKERETERERERSR